MNVDRRKLIKKSKNNEYIIGLATGAGVSTKHAVEAGIDLILALNSGKYRQMGVSSLAGFLPFSNCNNLVMEFGTREIIPMAQDVPVIFGLCATDPFIKLEEYVVEIKSAGFSGINNYPSVGMLDGVFKEALEEEHISYQVEVEAIKIANDKGLFTIAFVFDESQAAQMIDAGADVICAHLGFTRGGLLGAKKVLNLVESVKLVNRIFEVCDRIKGKKVMKMIYGGSVYTTTDLKYMYENTSTMGYIGGSSLERIPLEKSMPSLFEEFKITGQKEGDPFLLKMLEGVKKNYNYVDFVKEYIEMNYMHRISLAELAEVSHVSRSYLSKLFKKEVGMTFTNYLIEYRMNKAQKLIKQNEFRLVEIADAVGYADYAHFSKEFKKRVGISPRAFQEE